MGGLMRTRSADRIGKLTTLSVRLPEADRGRIEDAASLNGRSLAKEVEHRLARTFVQDDLRTLIREEIRAALTEERNLGSQPEGWINSCGDNLHRIPPSIASRSWAGLEPHASMRKIGVYDPELRCFVPDGPDCIKDHPLQRPDPADKPA